MTHDLFPETQLEPELVPDERYTPRAVFDPLHVEFRFTLDACATAESAKCKRFYTAAQDGLSRPWRHERVWCNPPYSDIRPWVEKAWRSQAELVVMLLPAWTDREWWAELVEPYRDSRFTRLRFRLATRFLRGRIRFGFPGNPEAVLRQARRAKDPRLRIRTLEARLAELERLVADAAEWIAEGEDLARSMGWHKAADKDVEFAGRLRAALATKPRDQG